MASFEISSLAGNGTPGFQNGIGQGYRDRILVGAKRSLEDIDYCEICEAELYDDQTCVHFHSPRGVAVDNEGNIFIFDEKNHCIRKLAPEGAVTTFAGTGDKGYQNGPSHEAKFNFENGGGIGFDNIGNLFVAEGGTHRIRKISQNGEVSTFAGNGTAGHTNGNIRIATFNKPKSMAFDLEGTMYVLENNGVRKISPEGVVTTLAGGDKEGFKDGKGVDAQFNSPSAICVASDGFVFVADWWNHSIRKITPSGVVSTIVGSTFVGFEKEDPHHLMNLQLPCGMTLDGDDNLIVADTGHGRVVLISRCGVISSMTGQGKFRGDASVFGEKFSPKRLMTPVGVAVDGSGNVVITDISGHCVRRLDSGLKPPLRLLVDSHKGKCVGTLSTLLEDKWAKFSDIQIHVGPTKKMFPAHRIILSRSPFFQAAFSNRDEFLGVAKEVVELEHITPEAFLVVLKYLYSDNLDFPLECSDLLDVHTTACFLLLTQLQQNCEVEIRARICEANWTQTLRYAHANSLEQLKRRCLEVVSSSAGYIGRVMAKEDFKQFMNEDAKSYQELLEALGRLS